ncbi:WPP domain-associated protein [Lactuca sativa]|uniref:WPP domain-associated protein n=1 Tax=Lactuca sativa TaxID=4236 RepID=UPI000CD872D4|nr:WPP domain-associated protein [Lactuca sativa]
MDKIVDEMDCRYRLYSILMNHLRSAMCNAQKKAQDRACQIECLIEKSKFYDLGIIQIDVSFKLIKEEEQEDQIPETNQKKILTDLIELKDLFLSRLNDTKCSIIQKDEELMEKLDYEVFPDMIMMEQMSSDLDMLKRTRDHAFKQIQKSEVEPLEKQWRLLIEKETILIAIKGYVHDTKVKLKSSIKFPVSKNQKSNKIDGVGKKDVIISRLMEERHESKLQTMAIDEHYMVLVNECCDEFWCYEIETKVKEDMLLYILHEVAKDWTEYQENESIKTQLKDEIYETVFLETINDIRIKLDFELQKIQNKISKCCIQNAIRLEHIKQQVKSILGSVATIKKEELIYKKAFARRCQNLLLAETEVDLLGDQVEALQDLLGKIYYVLVKNSSVLSYNCEVMDILKLIERKLGF